jgi:16S rRNA (guanine(966)-N(2))-methyltransferase RsmD
MMRIITGSAKGKRLVTLEGEATRPTSERIKEAIFSSIQFETENRRVLDLFAGSGQMGLEAMSRGAASVTFIDSSREAMEIVKENARTTGFFDKCRYLVSDYGNYIRKASGRDTYDLVFIDPPYAAECCADAVGRLLRAGLLIPGAIVVLESGTEEPDMTDPRFSRFEVIKSTRYGKKSLVNILFYKGDED